MAEKSHTNTARVQLSSWLEEKTYGMMVIRHMVNRWLLWLMVALVDFLLKSKQTVKRGRREQQVVDVCVDSLKAS